MAQNKMRIFQSDMAYLVVLPEVPAGAVSDGLGFHRKCQSPLLRRLLAEIERLLTRLETLLERVWS
jgi:hypothetical protein